MQENADVPPPVLQGAELSGWTAEAWRVVLTELRPEVKKTPDEQRGENGTRASTTENKRKLKTSFSSSGNLQQLKRHAEQTNKPKQEVLQTVTRRRRKSGEVGQRGPNCRGRGWGAQTAGHRQCFNRAD